MDKKTATRRRSARISRTSTSSNQEPSSVINLVDDDAPEKKAEKPTESAVASTASTGTAETSSSSSSSSDEDNQCGICFEKLEIQGILDSCKHLFCFTCIEHWSKTSNTCPMCKARFRQLTKKDLSKPNARTRKFKVKDVDQTIDPESYIMWDDDEDEYEFDDDPFLAAFLPLLAPSLFGMPPNLHQTLSLGLGILPLMHLLLPPPPQAATPLLHFMSHLHYDFPLPVQSPSIPQQVAPQVAAPTTTRRRSQRRTEPRASRAQSAPSTQTQTTTTSTSSGRSAPRQQQSNTTTSTRVARRAPSNNRRTPY